MSPVQQNITNTQPIQSSANYSAAAASLLAVLSDDPLPQPTESINSNVAFESNTVNYEPNTNAKTKKDKSRPKAEPIKLKIKTTARALENLEQLEETETHRAGKNTRRSTPHHTTYDNVPPSSDNLNNDHYRASTTNDHPVNSQQITNAYEAIQHQQLLNKQIFEADQQLHSDSERGILPKKRRGKNKSKFENDNIEPVIEEPLPKKRNRRRNDDTSTERNDIIAPQAADVVPNPLQSQEFEQETIPKKRMTAAARKQYSLPIEQLIEPAIIPESIKPVESEINNEIVSNSPKGRGRRAKAKPIQNPIATAKADSTREEEKPERSTRATRHTANGNMMQVGFLILFSFRFLQILRLNEFYLNQ